MNENAQQQQFQGVILDSIADGVFTVDEAWRIRTFNRAAEEITGVPREEAIGRRCCEVFRSNVCETDCVLAETLRTGKPIVNRAVFIVNADGDRIPISVSTALLKDEEGGMIGGVETFRDLSEVEELRKALTDRYSLGDLVGQSGAMREVFERIAQVADSDSTVLVEGPSGSGKELCARALHNLSVRREGPFVALNCGALPDTLLESELFGYKAGAFTDARADKPGRFELASGGTLFLDEIGDISPAMQVRLLRVLQERRVEPLGGVEPVPVDVRVIAATHQDLEQRMREGAFRQDLYYRINVIRLALPPLKDRREDIPLLVEHFIARFNRRQQRDIVGVSDFAMRLLLEYDYPGNVRELENIIEHAFVLCRGGMIEPEHLPAGLRPAAAPPSPGGSLKSIEAAYIEDLLRRYQGNRRAVARELGMHPSTLYRKIRALGVHVPERDGRHRAGDAG